MRNLVEIHGLEPTEALRVRKRIFRKFRENSLVNDLAVEIFPTDIEDRKRGAKPYLRLVNGCQNGTPLIINQLKDLGFDVGHVKLDGFYPKKK
jgi:hypothetical protein